MSSIQMVNMCPIAEWSIYWMVTLIVDKKSGNWMVIRYLWSTSIDYLMSPTFWQYHLNIKININDKHHFAFAYLLGKLDYSLYGQPNKNRLSMDV